MFDSADFVFRCRCCEVTSPESVHIAGEREQLAGDADAATLARMSSCINVSNDMFGAYAMVFTHRVGTLKFRGRRGNVVTSRALR